MMVEVIQYMKPNGRQRVMATDIRDHEDLKAALEDLLAKGYQLTAEKLNGEPVALYVEHFVSREIADIRIVKNGRAIQTALHEMILARKWETHVFEGEN